MDEISTALDVSALCRLGGREWRKGDMHRVYFEVSDMIAQPSTRGRGYIRFSGRELSGTKTAQILEAARASKVWIDVGSGVLHTDIQGCNALGDASKAPAVRAMVIEAMARKLGIAEGDA